jgi:hypothetical protein
MQRNPTTSHPLSVPGRFGAIARPDCVSAYPPPTRAVPRPATQSQAERPTLFASLCRSLVQQRQEQPVGGDVSPLLWW